MKLGLILEDLPESQALLQEIVQASFAGIRTRCEADVAGAMEAIQQFRFDLALIDLSLPDGDGTSVIQSIAALYPECIIVVASIYDDDAHLFPALRAGAHGYLLKDQPVDTLVRQLRGIGDGQPPLSPAVARRMMEYFRVGSEVRGEPDREALLTSREREVLAALARGISIAAISEELGISRYTAGDHVKNIYRKLNISSRAEAALQAKSLGLV